MARIEFPKGGLNDDTARSDQPPLTTAEALNVRTIDPTTGRSRGGQRAGTSLFLSGDINGAYPVQAMEQTMRPVPHFEFVNLGTTSPTASNAATGSVELIGSSVTIWTGFSPQGDELTISDGTTTITFEATFNEGFLSDDTNVAWIADGNNGPLSMVNLALVINEQDWDIGAAVDLSNGLLVQLQNLNPDAGTAGNVAIVNGEFVPSTYTITGMSGGVSADPNTLQTAWSKDPAGSSATLYLEPDGNGNVWGVTDGGTGVLYNADGALVATVQPPIPATHTVVPRIAVAADNSVFMASYAADGDDSRVWRFINTVDGYQQKWEIEVNGRVREVRENSGLLYVVTDQRLAETGEYGGLLLGYTGLTLGSPILAFSNECPMPTLAMDISPLGYLAMAHPFDPARGKSPERTALTAKTSAPDLWTPWDLTNYRERLHFWIRAEDALDASELPCSAGDEVVSVPDHRLSPPDGYLAPYDDTDRGLAKFGTRKGPLFNTDYGTPTLKFNRGYTASGLAGRALSTSGTNLGSGAKSTTQDPLSDTLSPIPNYVGNLYAMVFAIRWNDTTESVVWSQEDDANGTDHASYGFLVNTAGGLYSGGGFTQVDQAVYLDTAPEAAAGSGGVAGGDHTVSSTLVNYNEDASVESSRDVAIVSIVKGNVQGDGKSTSVLRVNGKQVDCFEFLYDLSGQGTSRKFTLGCRRSGDAEDGTGDLYTDAFGGYASFVGHVTEMITILGDSTASNSPHDIPVTCPLAEEGAGGSTEDGYSRSGSVATHTAHADPTTATEVELLEAYLAHKFGASSGLPLGVTGGVPRTATGYYEAHPFGGPGYHPQGPNRESDREHYLHAWTSMTTLWTPGGNIVDMVTGSGSGAAVGWNKDSQCYTGGALSFRLTDTLDDEKDVAFRRLPAERNQWQHPLCATYTLSVLAAVPDGEFINLSDNTDAETFEFTSGAASGGNLKVDTDVTATDYSTAGRLIALNFLAALEASGLDIIGFLASPPTSDPQVIQLIQGFPGTGRETAVTISSAGSLTGSGAGFDGGVNDGDYWRARVTDPLQTLSQSNDDGVLFRTDDDGNFYFNDRSLTSNNAIVRRKASDGSVQWRYLFMGDDTARHALPLANPPTYAGSNVTGPEFIYVSASTGAVSTDSIYKLRILRVDEKLSGGESPREAVYLAVCNGSIVKFEPNGSASVVTGGASVFSRESPYIQTAVLNNQVFFTDGLEAHYYDADEDAVLPFTSDTRSTPPKRFRLMASWRNRLVVARVPGDDTNWFMSRSGDAFDWDEFPAVVDAQQPVSGNTSKGRVGRSPDVINCLIPWSDDLLIIGGDRSILRMTGDPMQGAQVDLVSDSTGIAYLSPWCKDPDGTLYFFGSKGGVWVMPPGGMPQRITKSSIEKRMRDLDLGAHRIEMVWNYYDEGLHVFPVPYSQTSSEPVRSWFFDAKHGAWWEDEWQTPATAVRSILLADGDRPDDRRVLLGCKDGKVRFVDPSAVTDDGGRIDSSVLIGPLLPESSEVEARFTGLTSVLATTLGPISYEVLVGEDPETATVVGRGDWSPGRNPISRERWAGPCAWIRLRSGSADSWAMESMHVQVYPTSRKRIR